MKSHEENIAEFFALGGSEKSIKDYRAATLQNRAKVLHLVKELRRKHNGHENPQPDKTGQDQTLTDIAGQEKPSADNRQPTTENSTPSHKLLGFISEYPAELHQNYKTAFSLWLDACSLKTQLNAIPDHEEAQAYELQCAIYGTMQKFDQAKKALDFYKKERTVLPTEIKKPLPDDPLTLDRRLRSVRTLVTRRKATVAKLTAELPPPEDPKHNARKAALNKKIAELEEYLLELQEIENKLKK